MSLEKPFSIARAPQNDEGQESNGDFPTGTEIVSLEKLVEGINAATRKYNRLPNLDVVAHDMGLRTLDVLESFRRAPRQDVTYVLESVSRGGQRFERYLHRRAAIVKIRKEKQTYYIRDLAEELGISESAAKGHIRELGKGAEKLLGFTEVRAGRPKSPEPQTENIEEKLRAAYARAIIVLHKQGVRAITAELIAENVQGLQKRYKPWQVEVFLERNPGFIERVIAEEEQK